MKALARISGVLRAAVLAAAAALGASAAAAAWGAERPPAYDLTVLVYAPDVGPARVAISYPRVVDHAVIQRGLGELAQRTGAVISGVRIRDGKQGQGMAETATAVECVAAGLVQQPQGMLPVGPIIRSLPDWKHMRLVFVVGEGFRWIGPRATTADEFGVRLISSMEPYEYDVESRSGRSAPPAGATERKPVSSAVLPALLIGLPTGFAIGWLAAGDRQRSAPRSGRR
jgi:hypothetical protein